MIANGTESGNGKNKDLKIQKRLSQDLENIRCQQMVTNSKGPQDTQSRDKGLTPTTSNQLFIGQ